MRTKMRGVGADLNRSAPTQADAGVKVATIRRSTAAIHFRHVSAQVESPTHSMLVTAALKGSAASSA